MADSVPICEIGDIWTNSTKSCNGNGSSPVCYYPANYTDQGVCDMVGNVMEWLLDDTPNREVPAGIPLDGSAHCLNNDCEGSVNKAIADQYWWSTYSDRKLDKTYAALVGYLYNGPGHGIRLVQRLNLFE